MLIIIPNSRNSIKFIIFNNNKFCHLHIPISNNSRRRQPHKNTFLHQIIKLTCSQCHRNTFLHQIKLTCSQCHRNSFLHQIKPTCSQCHRNTFLHVIKLTCSQCLFLIPGLRKPWINGM